MKKRIKKMSEEMSERKRAEEKRGQSLPVVTISLGRRPEKALVEEAAKMKHEAREMPS